MIKAGNGVLQADVQPGDVKFVDINHDGRVNELDKTDLGNGIPDFTMGFNLGFNWKGLDFSVVVTVLSDSRLSRAIVTIPPSKPIILLQF